MKIGIIGAGGIGRTVGRLWAAAGHDVLVSWASGDDRLRQAAEEIGPRATAGTPAEAAAAEAVLFTPRFEHVEAAAAAAGPLTGRVVLDTTNPYNATRDDLVDLGGLTSAEFVSRRLPGARYVKTFNTLTAEFLDSTAGRPPAQRTAVFFSTDDPEAAETAARLIADAGFAAVHLGGLDRSALIDPPRRDGAVHGEEYRPDDAERIATALREGRDEEAARLADELKVRDGS